MRKFLKCIQLSENMAQLKKELKCQNFPMGIFCFKMSTIFFLYI